MEICSNDFEDLRTHYETDLGKALDMERKIAKQLFHLIENALDEDLADAFSSHLEETRDHIEKVEALLILHRGQTRGKTCKAIDGLLDEAAEAIAEVGDVCIGDIHLIGVAQQIEHHEIAVYGSLRRRAELLGLAHDAVVIDSIEADEMNADGLLSAISERANLIRAI